MPAQPLWKERERRPTAWNTLWARLALVLLVSASTAAFGVTLYKVLAVETPTVLQIVFLALCTVCFFWISIGSSSAVIGFVSLLARGHARDKPQARPVTESRTALLFPVYREDPRLIAAGIDTVCADLLQRARPDAFDVFILCDTQATDERTNEMAIFKRLSERYAGRIGIFARWRTPNVAKKAGNIRDWIERHGGPYHYFVVMDADSIMGADTLLHLVANMEASPRLGLLQTVPRLTGGSTLFARLQQFAAGYYGTVLSAGLAAWHGRGGNYWGHNAIVRTEAFARSAGLPELPGKAPLGGHILSHDFVEAALLRRGGWDVRMLPALEGSYEGCPPTLSDLIVRDRRWAQGNLQHLRLLRARGLTMLSRAHLLMGAFAYLSSFLWAATLLVGVMLAVQAKYTNPSYFGTEASLFPKWPVFDAKRALGLFFATLLVVHLPKILGGIWALRNADARRRNGGIARVVSGILFESLMAALIAPVLMITQTNAVFSILLGRDAGWAAQRRIGAAAPFTSFLRQHRWQLAWGIVVGTVCLAISLPVFAWMSPIIAGLLLSAPVAMLTAQQAHPALKRILDVQEDLHPPPILLAHAGKVAEWQAA